MYSPLTNAGRWLLNRRDFLSLSGTGLGGIAPTSIHAAEGRLNGAEPLEPRWSAARPNAPRPLHFQPQAKHILVISCSGALSHRDSWDYKPELIKRHDTPMPNTGEKFITFQGENGNLTKPLWEFKPRGQSGKMISELL